MDLNKILKSIQLDHDKEKLSDIFGITDDEINNFSREMAKKAKGIAAGTASVSEIIEHLCHNVEMNDIKQLLCFCFIAGMGYKDAEHKYRLEQMRGDVLDMAIRMKNKDGDHFKPSDLIDSKALTKCIEDSDGKEF
tara:strand:- start:647 stop:1054 length:408 start_codon:yes stop_codon:yes gene_type:complete